MFPTETRSQALRVPVRRAEVELRTEREAFPAVLFLPPESPVEEVLEGDAPFFPADAGGRIRFVARAALACVTVPEEVATPESIETLGVPLETRAVSVHLRGGHVLTGTLSLAPGVRRTLDMMNQRAKHITIRDGGKVHHIAKAHIDHVAEAP